MGCCFTKDVNTLKNCKKKKMEKNVMDLSNKLLKKESLVNEVITCSELIDKEVLMEKINEPVSSWIFNVPQIKELHAIWLISMLRQLRSEMDTICLLSRLMEIVELLDPFNGNILLRKHLFESGAAEVLTYTIKYHQKSPEILLLCIFLLIHISFNDGVSEKIIPVVSLILNIIY